MNTIQSSTKQNAILAILLAILLTTGSNHLVNIPHNVLDEFQIEPVTWNFSSSLSLSTQIQEAPILLGMNIDTYQVINKTESICTSVVENPFSRETSTSTCFGYATVPAYHYYNYTGTDLSITELEIWYITEEKELNYLLDDKPGQLVMYVETPVNDVQKRIEVDPLLLDPVTYAFSQDIKELTDLSNITYEEIETLYNNLDVGDNLWRISLIFADGTLMDFYYYGQTMIVRYMQLQSYISVPPGAMYQPINGDQIYPTYVSNNIGENPMSNFISSIMDFMEVVMHD